MKEIHYFGDDLGLIMYTFVDATIIDVINHLAEKDFFRKENNYSITRIKAVKKYWLFGTQTIYVIAETERAIKEYGGGKIPVYKIYTS